MHCVTVEAEEPQTLERLHEKTVAACLAMSSECIENLIVHGAFKIGEASGTLAMDHEHEASEWQKESTEEYLFCHGKYMNAGSMPGIDYIIEELRRKRDSNRACVQLVSVKDLVGSGDDPRPSFLGVQCTFRPTQFENLLITARYRALEVANFFPINLAELALIVRRVAAAFPEITSFELTVVAFRAYFNERFDCFKRHKLDLEPAYEISAAVEAKEYALIKRWLEEKESYESSYVDLSGLETLRGSVEKHLDDYSPEFHSCLKEALEHYGASGVTRQALSTPKHVANASIIRKVRDSLTAGLKELRAISERGDS